MEMKAVEIDQKFHSKLHRSQLESVNGILRALHPNQKESWSIPLTERSESRGNTARRLRKKKRLLLERSGLIQVSSQKPN
jgi:hypothetical protein